MKSMYYSVLPMNKSPNVEKHRSNLNWKGCKFLLLSLCSPFFIASNCQAQISVNDVIVQFKAGQRPVQNIIVKNSSKEVFYVTATSEEIQDPGEEKSALLPTEDLIVSPRRFSIDGNSERVGARRAPGYSVHNERLVHPRENQQA